MFYSIDYYAMTIPVQSIFSEVDHEGINFAIKAFISFFRLEDAVFSSGASWIVEGAKHPYKTRLRHAVTDVCLSIGKVNPHIYVEFAGKACNTFDATDQLDGFIRTSSERTSRIDFAVDIETEIDPRDFCASTNSKAFKSSGEKRTPSGRTSYVGGRSSERMARIYRYEPPHPRSHLLRVEAEYKGDASKVAAEHYLKEGLLQACLDAHSPFQWTHPSWTPGDRVARKIEYKKYRPENAATVHWLYGDVITALSKAVTSGLIDFGDWLEALQRKV